MRNKLVHPLWSHLPALAALVLLIVYVINTGPLPAEAPIHFDIGGKPDADGSPWMVLGLLTGLSIFFIVLSAFLDELWARQEKTKRFNWLSLFDDIIVGSMVSFGLGYAASLQGDPITFSFPWKTLLLVAGVTTLLAVILEALRPCRPTPNQPFLDEDAALKTELQKMLKGNSPFVYWDYQNPAYITLLTVSLPLVMFAAAVFVWYSQPWVTVLLTIVGIIMVAPYGGLRTLVNTREITVRFGIPGFRVLRLKTADIAAAELREFAPLRDFGGYGIRFNRDMKAYFMRGTRGVLLTAVGGKKYLIGSDQPERLLTVIEAIISGKSG